MRNTSFSMPRFRATQLLKFLDVFQYLWRLLLLAVSVNSAMAGTSLAAESSASALAPPKWQLLLFTIPGCSSCILMRDQVIHPMMATGCIKHDQFDEVVQISDADWHYVRGIGYKQIREWKAIYQTSLFPTLVVLDDKGNKIADNLVGMTSVEHYRQRLESILQRIEAQHER